jgi:hypothetical protein
MAFVIPPAMSVWLLERACRERQHGKFVDIDEAKIEGLKNGIIPITTRSQESDLRTPKKAA